MATTAGALSKVSVGATVASLSSAVATGGTAPYTYQWQRSLSSGSGYTNITGATSLTLNDSGLQPGTPYFYKVVATDSGSVSGTSSALAITTTSAAPSPNQFQQAPFLGTAQMPFNYNTLSVQFDPAGSGTLQAGQSVKFSTANAGAVSSTPMVVPTTSVSDEVCGYVLYNIKNVTLSPADFCEIAMDGDVIYLQACTALTRGQRVTNCGPDVTSGNIGGVAAVTGSSGYGIVGYALDTVAAGSLVRIHITTPSGLLDS